MTRTAPSLDRFGRGLIAAAVALVVVGVGLVSLTGSPWSAVGAGLIAAGAVLATSLVFYLIGRGEDRARAEEPDGRRRSPERP